MHGTLTAMHEGHWWPFLSCFCYGLLPLVLLLQMKCASHFFRHVVGWGGKPTAICLEASTKVREYAKGCYAENSACLPLLQTEDHDQGAQNCTLQFKRCTLSEHNSVVGSTPLQRFEAQLSLTVQSWNQEDPGKALRPAHSQQFLLQ